ncbi:hypothetical protein [Hymenobacter cellulosivorans]|uniref:Uncharacterized protein n=1 Tax=Hymenobacter cellulosivorans TaxID=2932249 RepID=A0ABY4FEC6_9BACT|nr:hypothetical protein [Hymenobacter cellulosivorans]UOQ55028.1 hypothetical protein MUN80_09785 [Hymenobacter cellulosivorans]
MQSHSDKVTAAANRIIQNLLLNTNVESFGILHQMPFIEFRNEHGSDMHLTFDSKVLFSPTYQGEVSDEDRMLIGMNSLNLKKVTKAQCNDAADLEIYFEGGAWLKISGSSKDRYEPWQLSNDIPVAEGGSSVIALDGGGYAIWEGQQQE